jgi:hypothetical protein
MTPAQRKQANALICKACCNYDNGNCLLLDDGEEVICPQSISYSVCCKWFRRAVLPQDKPLEAAIMGRDTLKRCDVCGKAFASASNNAKYCGRCAKAVQRRQKAEHARKRRTGVEK